jgi:hypothetical protein
MTPTNPPPSQPPPPRASASQAAHHDDEHLYDDEFMHNEDVAHEHSDVNVRQLLLYTAGLVITCVVCALIVGGLFVVFERQAAANDPMVSPLAAPADQLPPEPRLLTNEPSVLKKQRKLEAETLEHYGWVDQKGGIARLPIAEAKKKLLHDGIPSRADGGADAWMGTSAAASGESSGGRGIPIRSRKSDITILKPQTEPKPPQQGTKPGEPRKPH